MTKAADIGALILPPVPAFYHRPNSIQDLIKQTIGKALDYLDIEHQLFKRWSGLIPLDHAALTQRKGSK
jgi:4-hydroxy-3-polyprenylbenzoate decarboxylase